MAIAKRLHLPASPTADAAWCLIEDGFALAREHEIEALFAVANGYVGVHGALAEGSILSSPATFVAGVFELAPASGDIPRLAVAPDWTRLSVEVAGRELRPEEGEPLVHRRLLDLRQGILWREWRQRDPYGRVTRLRFLRLASLADRHVLLQSVVLTPENYSVGLRLESFLECAPPGDDLPAARGPELAVAAPAAMPSGGTAAPTGAVTLAVRTAGTGITIAFASATRLRTDEGKLINAVVDTREGRIVERWGWQAEVGKTARLDRLVCVYTSRDVEQPTEAAVEHLGRVLGAGVERVVSAHRRAWQERWRSADIQLAGDAEAQRALRFAAYHLISAANPADEAVSIGARALTGTAYQGHVFWDTEVYLVPFYLLTYQPAARALLLYRYHTLPAAREKARALGYRGALFAWESADRGEETTPPLVVAPDGEVITICSGEQEHHISADIAYAVWRYWQGSGDEGFLAAAGAEIILETARFWASRGQVGDYGRYHIRRVIGPDEYHEDVDDNAYTNGMAQWNLERGAEVARLLQERWPERWRELVERLALAPGEPQEWLDLAHAMYTGFDPRTGLFEQFRGYFALEEIDLAVYAGRSVPMDVLLGREHIRRSKVIKQADVVMLLYMLWDRFSPQVREANFRFYEPRTGHGSSLSPAIHALVAARLGDLAMAERYFRQAAEVDLANNMGNAAGGVHMAALGGLWQAAVFGFAGLQVGAEGLTFDPHLLPEWRTLRFPLAWRGRRLFVTIAEAPPTIEVQNAGGQPLSLGLLAGPRATILSGQTLRTWHAESGWASWQEVPK